RGNPSSAHRCHAWVRTFLRGRDGKLCRPPDFSRRHNNWASWNLHEESVSNSSSNPTGWSGGPGVAIVGASPVAEDLMVPSARPGSWQDLEDREATLVARCAQGDEAACVDLVTEHQR